jgi:glycosyltransferase involved in cell wall biosynthesis
VMCPSGEYLATWATEAGATWIELGLSRAPSVRDLVACARVRSVLRSADVVHLHSSKASAVGRLAAMTLGRARPRVVFTPHGWSWYVGGPWAAVYRRFEQLAGRWADVVTVVSADELQAGRAVLGPSVELVLIENGVDTDRFSPGGTSAQRSADPLIVHVGRLSVQKGQDRSIRALAALPDASARLRLVGDGPDRVALGDLVADLGLSHRVEFAGSVDPRPHLRCADVVALPSRWEGMSLVLLESMAVGAAIISSTCGGSDALAGCGLLVPHDDDERAIAGLIRHLTRLLSEPSERAILQQRARLRAIEMYSLDEVLRKYREIWAPEHAG